MVDLLSAAARAGVCLDPNDTVDAFYVVNLNLINIQDRVEADSDADGMPDSLEIERGFDPLVRRKKGVLDSICWNLAGGSACESLIPACVPTQNELGLSDCDIKALGLDTIYGHPTQGLDSDKDAMPDIAEILRGTLPNIDDALADPDHDGILNQEEMGRGSNPLYSDAVTDSRWVITSTASKGSAAGCTGEHWNIKVNHLPLIGTKAFTEIPNGGPNLSHAGGENMIMTVIKVRPKPGHAGNTKMLFNISRVGDEQTLQLSTDDFANAGEMEP